MADQQTPLRQDERYPVPSGQSANVVAGPGGWGATPQMTNGMTFGEYGQSGLRAFSGWVREEFVPELVGRQGARTYREMADNSPIVGSMLYAIKATMLKVQWRVIPPSEGGDAQEKADFVDSLMRDMSHTWEEHVDETLSMLTYGYAPHEIVYKRRLGRNPGNDPRRPGRSLPKSDYDDGLIGWRRIPLRGQETILKWFFDENGTVTGVTQQPWTGPIVDLPIEKMLLFRPSVHKGNPEGRSILRNAWRPYHFTKRIEEQEAIMFERLNGVPVVRVPNTLIEQAKAGNADAVAMLNSYKQMATNLRINEQMGILLSSQPYIGDTGQPSQVYQYDIQLLTPEARRTGAVPDTVLTRYATQMLQTVMADFLALGHGARGTQALAINKTDMFLQAIEGLLNNNAAVYKKHGLPRVWALNGFDEELLPEISPDLAQRVDLDVLSNFVLRLSQSGMPMFPNEEMQQLPARLRRPPRRGGPDRHGSGRAHRRADRPADRHRHRQDTGPEDGAVAGAAAAVRAGPGGRWRPEGHEEPERQLRQDAEGLARAPHHEAPGPEARHQHEAGGAHAPAEPGEAAGRQGRHRGEAGRAGRAPRRRRQPGGGERLDRRRALPAGEQEAQDIAAALADKGIDIIFHSDLIRARATAQAIAARTGAGLVPCPGLRCWNMGAIQGEKYEDVKGLITEYMVDRPWETPPGGESFWDFKFRVFKAVEDALDASTGQNLALVTHSKVERLLQAWTDAGSKSDLSTKPATLKARALKTGEAKLMTLDAGMIRVALNGMATYKRHMNGSSRFHFPTAGRQGSLPL
jgi:broad specificity phosphatase PhoE